VSSSSPSKIRELNQVRVLDALRQRGAASRSDLASVTGLSRATVATLVSGLQAQGLVVERASDPDGSRGRGRRPTLLELDSSAGVALGVDFGHRHVRVAVADLSSAVLGERYVPVDVDSAGIAALDAAAQLVGEVLDEAGVGRSRVIGAGMGLPGPIDRRTGAVSPPVILPGWTGIDGRAELEDRLGVHVELDNDANLGALAEVTYGAGRGHTDVVYVKYASGIGAGIVLGGRIHRGVIGISGEIGHVQARADGEVCACGNRGCLQTAIATDALLESLRPIHGEVGVPELLDLVASGDHGARRIVTDAGRTMGRVLSNVCNLLNPAAVVIGGDLSALGDPLLAGIRESIDRYSLPGAAQTVDVALGMLGDRAEVLGALALVIGDTELLSSAGLPTRARMEAVSAIT
jgi:predicted NBD/HSP70 family sugar kinase